jgi:multiple sugar transport system permease protein
MSVNKNGKRSKILVYIILIVIALFTLFPFLWAISASFKPYKEITGGGLNLIPETFTTMAYKVLFFTDDNFLHWVFNSFYLCIIVTMLNIILNSMAGYSLARIHFKGRAMVLNIILATIMVPAQILMIPNYLIIKELGLLNTYSAIFLPTSVSAAYIFMMRQFYVNFPKEVEEAAEIDGLGRLGVFFKIAIPLAVPSIATMSVFTFLGCWNSFLIPKLYLADPKKYTLTVGIQTMMSRYSGITQWEQVMAASVISLVPILIIYIVLNKYFMQGIRMDGEK